MLLFHQMHKEGISRNDVPGGWSQGGALIGARWINAVQSAFHGVFPFKMFGMGQVMSNGLALLDSVPGFDDAGFETLGVPLDRRTACVKPLVT